MSTPLKDVYEELQFISDRISTQSRTIALSVLALVWLFFAGGSSSPVLPSKPDQHLLLVTGALCLGSLLFDYFQYVFGYFGTDAVRKKAETAGAKEATYHYTDIRYRARTFFFWGKQVLALAALACLAFAVVSAFRS